MNDNFSLKMNNFELFACLLALLNISVGVFSRNCPCSNSALCQPIKKQYDKELFIFSVDKENWPKYDWNKLTTVVLAGWYSDEFLCHAHSKGVRVSYTASFPEANLTNPNDRSRWVRDQLTNIQNNFLDGINVDFESTIVKSDPASRDGLTYLMHELNKVLKLENPVYQVTFDYAYSPKGVDSRSYDYKGIADIIDFVFIMSYDERSQICGPCTAWANSPFNMTRQGIDDFLKIGIPAKKMIQGVPWYGYNYPCIKYTEGNICHLKEVPFRGVNCSDAAGKEIDYSYITETLLPISTTGRLWDVDAMSPYFTYKHPDTGALYQVWYDDPVSLSIKYRYAMETIGLLGVGMWTVDAVDYSDNPKAQKFTTEMWDALPQTRF